MKQITLLIFFLCAAQLSAQKGDWYNDEGGYTFEGLGTKDEPFLISSISGLAYLADQVNMTPGNPYGGVCFKLTQDLDIGAHYWISIGCDAAHPFQGNFDGNGKTIHNLYVNNSNSEGYPASGLFGYLGNGSRIENLTIEGGQITGDASLSISYTGSLAGYMLCSATDGEDSIIIRNCHNNHARVIGGETAHSNTGGLLGEGYAFCDGNGSVYILIENCSNSGEVIAASSNYPYTGGIIGKGRGHGYCDGMASSSGSFIISSCANNGTITGGHTRGDEAVSSAGGIFGYGYASGDGYGFSEGSGVFTVYLCVNNGFVKGGDATSASAMSFAGGIFGYGDGYGYGDKSNINHTINNGNGYGSGKFSITSCANQGVVGGGNALDQGAVTAAGGIFGCSFASASGDEQGKGYGYGAFSMRNCYNAGDVSGPSGCAGGLGGWISTNGNGPNHTLSAIIQDCFAAGSVNKEAPSSAVCGGIVGRIHKADEANSSPRIDRCVAALTCLNGTEENTFRIAGQVINAPISSRLLSDNYAYVSKGNWGMTNTVRNGAEWSGLMSAPPMNEWNATENAWQFPRSNNVMPRLRGLPGQTNVPVPY
ncbi:MAG: hypothetical protein LBJ60_09355 [Tannerellaceae bacterium]|jgi:hypothetical protein|nr:hypothetical protein [Tannerellaceae bacterium]